MKILVFSRRDRMRDRLGLAAVAGLISLCACGSEAGVRDQETPVLPEHASATPNRVGAPLNEGSELNLTAPPQAKAAATTERAQSCGAPIDTNQNGLVEKPEYLSFRGFAFDNWDVNDDLQLSPAEFHICWRSLGWGESSSAFQKLNRDGNSYLAKEEFFPRHLFGAWDRNGDASLSRLELGAS